MNVDVYGLSGIPDAPARVEQAEELLLLFLAVLRPLHRRHLSRGVATIGGIQASEGKLYLCAIKDRYSNRIVGYSIDSRMKSSLAASAFRNAIALRSPARDDLSLR